MRGDPEDPLERRLGDLVREWPDLAGAAEVYRVTLPLLRNVRPIAAPISLTGDQARRKLAEGEYLLHGVPLVFDHGGARELMLGLARNLEKAGLAAISPIRSALEGDRLVLEDLLGHVSDGDYPSLAARAEEQALDPLLLWTLAQSALKPTLRDWCGKLSPLVHAAGEWEKPCCFICGAPASLGELQGNEQAKAPALRAVRRGLAFPPATMYLLRQRGPLPSRHPFPGRPARERPGGGVRQVPWLSQGGCPLRPRLSRRAGGRGPLHPLPGLPRAGARLPSPAPRQEEP